jgi:mRNA-degrading endonuclease toxin of MazEF toxin-antitoxin module
MEYFLALLRWLQIKILLVSNERNILFHEGEIWWCSIGLNIGEEEFGKGPEFRRPVLIFKKFTNHSFFGIPLTGSAKTGSWYIPIHLHGRRSSLMLNQGKIFDGKRLQRKMVRLRSGQCEEIRQRFKEFYGL